MISTIGVMIGFYVATRSVSLVTRTGDRRESTLVRLMAIATAIVAVGGVVLLVQNSQTGFGNVEEDFPTAGAAKLPPVREPLAAPIPTLVVGPAFDESHPLQLELAFTDPSWVEALIDGRHRVSELRVEGETLRLSAADSIVLTLGNAGATTAKLNGRPLRIGGEPGQVVRDLIITKETLTP